METLYAIVTAIVLIAIIVGGAFAARFTYTFN